MSKMSDLDAELRASGIDPEGVDLERIGGLRCAYHILTGDDMTPVDAARELYIGKTLKWGEAVENAWGSV